MLGLLLILIRGTAASPIAQNAQRSDGASGVPPELAPLLPPELECGSILVPLDHDNAPSPDTFNADNSVRIGMSRLNSLNHNASSSADRKSIMISPGGPGLAAWITLLVQLQAESAGAENVVVSKAIREEYDVIAMDARGTGLSQSLKCDNTLRATRPDITVNTREEWDALAEWNRAYGESCLKMSGGLVKFMDSQSVAKDMELVRQVRPTYCTLLLTRVG
jgi:pimeloyl-ACP methyl ester carboxylesterase